MERTFKSPEEIMAYLDMREIRNSSRLSKAIYQEHGPIIHNTELKKIVNIISSNESPIVKEKTLESTTTKLYSDHLFEWLNFAAERVRRDIFGSPDIPFASYDEAILWIEEKQAELYSDENMQKAILFDQKYDELRSQVKNNELIGIIGKPFIYLPYKLEVNEDGLTCQVVARFEHSKELRILQRESESLTMISRFSQYEIVKFILCGEKPELIRYDVKVLEGSRKSIVITINTPDLRFDEIKEIYNMYRKEFRVKHKKRLNPKQEKILSLVKELEETLKNKGTKEYYTKLFEEWNSRYPDEKYSNWQSLLKAHKNIVDKIKNI